MKFTEAMAVLSGLEIDNKEEILAAINLRTKEANRLEKEVQDLTNRVDTILQAAGAEGDDFEKKLESAKTRLETLTASEREAREAIAAKDKELGSLRRESTVRNAALKAGATFEVLNQLLGDAEVAIEGETVTIAGKPLKEHAESAWKPFLPALFPAAETPPPSGGLPDGPRGGQPQDSDAVDAYLKTYSVPDYLKPAN